MRSPDYIEGFVDALKFVVKSFEEVKVNSPQSDVHSLDRTVNDGSKETKDADTNEEQIKSELYRDLLPQDGGNNGK